MLGESLPLVIIWSGFPIRHLSCICLVPIDCAAFRSTANTHRNKHFFCNPERYPLALKSQLLPLTKSGLQRGFSPGAPASCHSQKNIQDRWTGDSEMSLGVNASVSGPVYDSFVMNWLSGSASVWLTNGYQGFSSGSVRSNYNTSEKAQKEKFMLMKERTQVLHTMSYWPILHDAFW